MAPWPQLPGLTVTHRRPPVLPLVVAVVAGMVGLSFASVPLYRLFCE